MSAKVAIVGRPSVGKSTLFNRMLGRRAAIVENTPGVTRDRNEATAEWVDREFTLIDTGGVLPNEADPLLKGMRAQAQVAIEQSALVLFVVDARAGLTPLDQQIAEDLRKSGKPVLLVVNKAEGTSQQTAAAPLEFWRLGFDRLATVSAEHGQGIPDLMEQIVQALGPEPTEARPDAPKAIRVAIVGRPNVGKSTLVNALLRQERFVASELPGTTRDAIDAELELSGRRFVLTDTAGIRRKSTISLKVEQDSVSAALRAIEKSDVAVLVLDATEAAVDQDARIAQLAHEKGRALLLAVNKWDLIERSPGGEDSFRASLKERLKFVAFAPIVFTSALQRRRVDKILEVAGQLYDELTFRAPTPKLNRLLTQLQDESPAPLSRGKPLRLYYIAQVAAAPPTFTITCNRPQDVPDFYERFIINHLRSAFRLRVPLRLLWRERPGQIQRQSRKRGSSGQRRRNKSTR